MGHNVPFSYNRKEAKDHGEGGNIIGAPLAGRVLIIDDVISAGTSVRESEAMIRAAGAVPAGVLIALDRQERGQGALSAARKSAATTASRYRDRHPRRRARHAPGAARSARPDRRDREYRRQYGA